MCVVDLLRKEWGVDLLRGERSIYRERERAIYEGLFIVWVRFICRVCGCLFISLGGIYLLRERSTYSARVFSLCGCVRVWGRVYNSCSMPISCLMQDYTNLFNRTNVIM